MSIGHILSYNEQSGTKTRKLLESQWSPQSLSLLRKPEDTMALSFLSISLINFSSPQVSCRDDIETLQLTFISAQFSSYTPTIFDSILANQGSMKFSVNHGHIRWRPLASTLWGWAVEKITMDGNNPVEVTIDGNSPIEITVK